MKDITATCDLPASVRLSTILLARLRDARVVVFPNGQADVQRDGHVIFVNNRGRIPLGECERFISWAKPLASITYDPTGDILQLAYANWFAGYYPGWWCCAQAFVADFKINQMLACPPLPVMLSGGDGSSDDDPVIVRVSDTRQGLTAVYGFLSRTLGPAGTWRVAKRRTLKSSKSSTEQFEITLIDGTVTSLFFRLIQADASENGTVVRH